MPSPLNGPGKLPLVFGTISRNPPWDDPPPLGEKGPQQMVIFIINGQGTIGAEPTDFFPPIIPSVVPSS